MASYFHQLVVPGKGRHYETCVAVSETNDEVLLQKEAARFEVWRIYYAFANKIYNPVKRFLTSSSDYFYCLNIL